MNACVQLLTLKRDTGTLGGGVSPNTSSAVLPLATGLCFDFCPARPQVFVVGTEEGVTYKCSKDYSGQFLGAYKGRTVPCPYVAVAQHKVKVQQPIGSGCKSQLKTLNAHQLGKQTNATSTVPCFATLRTRYA